MTQDSTSMTVEARPTTLFGEFLLAKGLITEQRIEEALEYQRRKGGRIAEVVVELNILSERQVTMALAEHLPVEYFNLDDFSTTVDMNIARELPENIAKQFCAVAVAEDEDRLVLAMADPLNVLALDTITLRLHRQVRGVISPPGQIRQAIETVYHGSDVAEQQLRDLVEFEVGADDDDDLLTEEAVDEDISGEAAAKKAPVIRFVDLLLAQAVRSRASDIHIEPQEHSMDIRMRIDGVLRQMMPPPRKMQAAVTARLKILAKADIAERRLPQDGRFKIKTVGRSIDVRVSIIPTIYGEKVVMRILDSAAVGHEMDQLGFEPYLLTQLKRILAQPHGIIVVTGPTGSGKSTTLYSVLNYLKDPAKNITTVEDPVEYRLAGINQIQVRPEIDLTFALCLRSILRQDPDIILIGEIRDKETVDIAIKASLTGHLVLSTFHTNDAPSAVSRLVYMGIEPYLLASTLNLVVAQRLVRRVCEYCRQPLELTPEMISRLKATPGMLAGATPYHGVGCKKCVGTGYLGRLPIFEFMMVDEEMKEALAAGAGESRLRAMAREKGYGGLLESGTQKVLKGLTSPEEVFRVTYADNIVADCGEEKQQ